MKQHKISCNKEYSKKEMGIRGYRTIKGEADDAVVVGGGSYRIAKFACFNE